MENKRSSWGFPHGDDLERVMQFRVDNKARNRSRKTFRRNRLVRPPEATSEPSADALTAVWFSVQEALVHVSPRELEVLKLEARGFNDLEIAAQLGIHRNTVRNDRNRAYAKLRRVLGHKK